MENSFATVIVLDLSPSLWLSLVKAPQLSLRAVVDQCFAFIASQNLFHADPYLSLIVCDEVSSTYIWPPFVPQGGILPPNHPTPPNPPSLRPPLTQAASEYVRAAIAAFMERPIPASFVQEPPVYPSPGSTSALTRAVCSIGKHISRTTASAANVIASSATQITRDQRIVIISPLLPMTARSSATSSAAAGGTTRGAPHLPAAFAARAIGCPIDAILLKPESETVDPTTGVRPYQAACELTGGVWVPASSPAAIPIILQSCVAVPPLDRDTVPLPRSSGGAALHLEATCSQRGTAFATGAVCSICFAPFCKEVAKEIEDSAEPRCPKCKTALSTEW